MKITALLLIVLSVSTANHALAGNNSEIGVLLLAHGGKHASWDESVENASNKIKENYLIEVAFGMANPVNIQAGIDKLESQGVTKIVVVPLFISSFSPIIRQNEFLLGFRDVLADPPMLMFHHSGDHSSEESKKPATLEPLQIKAEIILTKPLDSSPFVAEILFDRISELSVKPEAETVLIVAHGPSSETDNNNWVKTIENLSDQIRVLQSDKSKNFKQIYGLTVRDDADSAIYEQAKEHLRTLVSQSGKDGEIIVIPLLLSQGGVEARYVKRLEGLTYKWSGKTLLPHQNITTFIQASVASALE